MCFAESTWCRDLYLPTNNHHNHVWHTNEAHRQCAYPEETPVVILCTVVGGGPRRHPGQAALPSSCVLCANCSHAVPNAKGAHASRSLRKRPWQSFTVHPGCIHADFVHVFCNAASASMTRAMSIVVAAGTPICNLFCTRAWFVHCPSFRN